MENTECNSCVNDEFLLQCVANYKPLYDKTDKGYKSILQKENCWASVAKSLFCTVPEAKARFKSLREKYRRELQIIEKLGRSGAPASARPVWPLMSFFKYIYKCGEESQRHTTSNIPVQVDESQASQSSSLVNSDEESIILQFEEEDPNTVASTSTIDNTRLTAPTPKKRKGKSTMETEIKQIDSVLLDVSTAITNLNSNKKYTDRYELFGQFMASELKNIGEPNASILMEDLQVTIINFTRTLRSTD
ncbi:uncharacterized protein LOC115883774 [Sitophilus oryzae]|uniref:Uncharacterized protein LOC115883774 n=1 Tax=Sitophilus oryzae TaxID=7048 RepID=A0A6J2Y4W4_SITOR|nr:uncharacterized protein LOC115883774 [Sitophilus oryzae]